jgi:hypothetical protein
MKLAKLLFIVALTVTTGFALTRMPLAVWSQPGESSVVLAANHGIVAVSYANVHGAGATNTIQLYEDLSAWQQIATLTVSDANASVFSVALTANYLVAGTFDAVSDSGAAYVFVKPSAGWQNATETAKLLPSDSADDNAFGSPVAAWGPTIVVGASGGGPTKAGLAYVYEEPAGGWINATQNARLQASDGGTEVGYSVTISGRVGGDGSEIALGAPTSSTPGAVYVFQEPSTGWTDMTQTAKLTNGGGKVGDNLGRAVAMSSDVIVAGAPFTTINEVVVGALAVFVKPQGGWADTSQPAAKLTDPSSEILGSSVGITQSGSQIVACCGRAIIHRNANLAYLFNEPNGGWGSEAAAAFKLKLTRPNDQAAAVAITKGFAAVGAFDNSNSPAVGTYIFAAQ